MPELLVEVRKVPQIVCEGNRNEVFVEEMKKVQIIYNVKDFY